MVHRHDREAFKKYINSTYLCYVCFCVGLCLELGEGPFTLSATELNDSVCVLGANVSSGEVFPLLKSSAQPTAIFNLMITSGLYKDRASRKGTRSHSFSFIFIWW